MTLDKFIKDNRHEIDVHIKDMCSNMPVKINMEERRLWVLNDENLYLWAQSEGVNV